MMKTIGAYWISCAFLLASAVCMAAPMQVFVSIEPQLESVVKIGGELVDVHALVPAGANPETYVPGPRTMSALGRTAIYFRIGAPFEEALLRKLREMFPELKIVDTTRGMVFREMDAAEKAAHAHCGHHHAAGEVCECDEHREHDADGEQSAHNDGGDGHGGHDADGQHEHGELDPHVWLSVGNMMAHARNVGDALCVAFPQQATEIGARTATVLAELKALDEEIALVLSSKKGQKVFVFHPAFGYFLSRYELIQTPVELGGKEPTGRHLCHLIREAREHGIRYIYSQPQFNSQTAEVLAEEIGGKVLPLNPLPRDYCEGMREMCRQLMK